jgi:hypothetical protein
MRVAIELRALSSPGVTSMPPTLARVTCLLLLNGCLACSRRRETTPAPPPSTTTSASATAPRDENAEWLQRCDPKASVENFCPSGTDLRHEVVKGKHEMWCVRRSDGERHGGFMRCDERMRQQVLAAYRNGVRTSGTCGDVPCPPSAVCSVSEGTVGCTARGVDAGSQDSGVARCGAIFCAPPCTCADTHESACACPRP